jgi:hypothetical protein
MPTGIQTVYRHCHANDIATDGPTGVSFGTVDKDVWEAVPAG